MNDDNAQEPVERQGQLFPAPPPSALLPGFAARAAVHLVVVPEFGAVRVESFERERYDEYRALHAALLRDREEACEVMAFFGVMLEEPAVEETVVAENPWGA